MSALAQLGARIDQGETLIAPEVGSFEEFLRDHAMVRISGGRYVKYSFEGRKPLLMIVREIDRILGSAEGNDPIQDALLAICGGAQFGKTVLILWFMVYLTAVRFLNCNVFLPTSDMVESIVDAKFRPEILNTIDWVNDLIELGKTKSESGKTVSRKGAFMTTSGDGRTGFGMFRGMEKVPTSFSADVAIEDERDDIKDAMSKYLSGRMTASDLRFRVTIGTQRMAGAGQHKQFMDGSQGVFLFAADHTEGELICPEELWPEVCRLQLGDEPSVDDPKLSATGDFVGEGGRRHPFLKGQQSYYLASPLSGAPIDRDQPVLSHRDRAQLKAENISIRISQLGIAAIGLNQIVSRWQNAVRDPDSMIVFRCEVLADPKSSAQALTPEIITRAREVEPFDMSLAKSAMPRFAGLDTGNRCWFWARESEGVGVKRTVWAEDIPAADVVKRVVALSHLLGIDCLFLDAHPLLNEARQICYAMHGLDGIDWPVVSDPNNATLMFPGGLTWHGPEKRWTGLRAAAVRFTKRPGQGIEQKIEVEETIDGPRYYPVVAANREESIERVVNELLTPEENVVELIDGLDESGRPAKVVREQPAMRLPQVTTGAPKMATTLGDHLLTGARRDKGKDGEVGNYVDQCENHLLLANAYSALAEMLGSATKAVPMQYEPVDMTPRGGSRRGQLNAF